MHGTKYANYAIQESDLILAIGARFDDRVTGKISSFAPLAKIVHIDVDPAEVGKNVRVDIPVVGDARNALTGLLKRGFAEEQGTVEREDRRLEEGLSPALHSGYEHHQAPVCD